MRFLKQQNLDKFRRTSHRVYTDSVGRVEMRTNKTLLLPKGNQEGRPLAPENGQIRYNTDIQDIEVFVNGKWRCLRYKEPTEIVQQSLGYGDYVTQQFGPLYPVPAAGQNIMVFIENIMQLNNVNYTMSQDKGEWWIYFDQPPPNKLITVLHNFDS